MEEGTGLFGLIRKIVGFALFVVGVFSLISLCMSSTVALAWEGVMQSINPFDLQAFGTAVGALVKTMDTSLIMVMLGLIGMR